MEKINKESRAFKYYEAKKLGKSKKESALVAGYSPSTARVPTIIEKGRDYQLIENHFKDQLEGKITLGELADALVDNIRQKGEERIDRGARNKAVEIALDRLEPKEGNGEGEQVIIILK